MSISAQTLQAIGSIAGVSKMSVSRALRNQPGVSAELRQKILTIAHDLGYRPNPLISALMSSVRAQRSRPSAETGTVLAFLERADRLSDARHEHFQGASQAAEEQGYKLERFIEGEAGLTASRLNGVLLARNIHGLVIAPLPEDHGSFDLDWSQFCTVTIEYTFTHPTFDRVVHDNYAAMRLILEKCRSRGLSKIGLFFSKNGRERTMGLNEAAYWMEQKVSGFFPAIPPLCLDTWSDLLVSRWFERYKPEVIVASSTFLAMARTFLERHKLRVPEDVSIINVNTMDSTISGIDQNNAKIGATAIRLLIDKINCNDRGIPCFANTTLTPGIWVEGKTIRP